MVLPEQLSRLLDVDGCRAAQLMKVNLRSRLGRGDCDNYKSMWLESLLHEGRWFPVSGSGTAALKCGNGRGGQDVSAVLATKIQDPGSERAQGHFARTIISAPN